MEVMTLQKISLDEFLRLRKLVYLMRDPLTIRNGNSFNEILHLHLLIS